MSRNSYRPYRSRNKSKKNWSYFVISVLILVGLYFAIRWIWGEDSQPSEQQPQIPVAETVKPIKPKPRAVTTLRPSARNIASTSDVRERLNSNTSANSGMQSGNVSVGTHETNASKTSIVGKDASGTTTPDAATTPIERFNQLEAKPSEQLSPEDLERNAKARALILEASSDITKGNIIAARDKLNNALHEPLTSVQRKNIKSKLSELSNEWLFSTKVLPGDTLCCYYKVQSGDLLSKIGKKFNVPWEFILKTNKLSRPENLRAGARLKVVNGPFHAIVNRSDFTLDLYLQSKFVKSYKVGLGKIGHETPTGMWQVKNDKLISPNWTDPDTGKLYDATDPDYPLGKRWVGLKGVSGDAEGKTGFALHGTKEPESIGKRSSRGCIRLLNKNIIEIYDLMVPYQSQVQVKD